MSATPNPAQVMSTLRMLGDKELAQYASMHKKDPYIFPLAFQESNLRKQMRAQGAGSAGPQPPINDQALQAMATQQAPMPEDVGLGRIAPPGVANMAGGGIVGFAGGGNPIEEQIMTEREEIQRGARKEFSPEVRAAMRNRPMSLDPAVIPGATGRGARPTMQNDPRLLGPTPANETTGFAAERDRNMAMVHGTGETPPAVAPVPEAKPGVPPAAGLGALGMGAGTSMSMSASGATPPVGPGIPRMEMPAKPGVFDPDKAYDERMARPTVDPLAEQRQGVVDAEGASAKRQYEGLQGLAARQDQILNKQEGRLDARQGDIEKESKRNEAMAWITAGLEMLQARGPGLSAIAGGAQKGFGQYAAGLEKAKLAQERIDDARDKLDAARLGTERERLSAQREYDMALNAGKREMFKGVESAYGVKSSVAQNMVKMYADSNLKDRELYNQAAISNNDNATRLQIGRENNATEMAKARLQADAHVRAAGASGNKQLEIARILGDGDVKAGWDYMQNGKFEPRSAWVKVVTAHKDMLKEPPSYNEFRVQLGLPPLLINDPKAAPGGKILDAKQ